jgi:hypothetical protein
MSWNSPQNWVEVTDSVRRGFSFSSRRLGVSAKRADAVCGHYSTRGALSGHLDMFARRIMVSNDELHTRYMSSNRWQAERDDDVAYFVMRDGNALAYVTRVGEVVVNSVTEHGLPRYRNALARLLPALREYATYRANDERNGYAARERVEAREAGLL